MKSYTLATGLLVSAVVAFPHLASKLGAPQPIEARQIDPSAPQGRGALPLTPPPFDAEAQLVSVSGEHAFVPPGPGDARGPCPGLNALANHNYIPHNGRATIGQFRSATEEVFGMGGDLGGFLSLYGALVNGNGLSWSISGGPREGIGGSHNNYETDSSPLRADLAQFGSNERLVMSQFFDLYNRQPDPATANYNLEVLRDFRRDRLQESKDKNPLFAYLPFSGIEVSQAAFTFIYRFMGNKSEEFPAGVLNKEVLKSFMSIQGPEDDLRWVPGNERIPDNWYKRNPRDNYGVVPFELDILYFAATVPEILQIGCNKGTVDSFELLDPQLLSNGAFTAQQVLENPVCFATQFALAQIPLLTALNLDSPLLRPVVGLLNGITSGLGLDCPAFGRGLNQSAIAVCPGLSFYGGPRGPVAPGAIQT